MGSDNKLNSGSVSCFSKVSHAFQRKMVEAKLLLQSSKSVHKFQQEAKKNSVVLFSFAIR